MIIKVLTDSLAEIPSGLLLIGLAGIGFAALVPMLAAVVNLRAVIRDCEQDRRVRKVLNEKPITCRPSGR